MKKLRTSYLWNHFEEIDEGVNRKGRCRYCNDVLSIQLGATGNLTRHLKAKHPKVETEARKPHNTFGRRRSLIWQHFDEIGEDRNLRAQCKHCNQILSIPCRVTGNLIRHLYAKHPTVNFERTPRKSRKDKIMEKQLNDDVQTEEIEYVVHCDNDEVYIFENTSDETIIGDQNVENVEIIEEQAQEQEEDEDVTEIQEGDVGQKIEIEFSDYEGYANYITMKLQNLAAEQRLYAQKIIEEAIDHAESCNLNSNSCVDLIGMNS